MSHSVPRTSSGSTSSSDPEKSLADPKEPNMNHHSVPRTSSGTTSSSDLEKCHAGAKEARKRAKEKARSMHSRIFRKRDKEDAANDHLIQSNSTSHRHRISRQGSMSRARRRASNKRSSIGSVSIDSISELEAVIAFNDDGDSFSSISQLTGSFESLHSSFTNSCMTQGPAVFEPKDVERRSAARAPPRMPNRALSKRQLTCTALSDSNSSLSLEDIKEDTQEETTSTTVAALTDTARESSTNTTIGINPPVLVDSAPDLEGDTTENSGREWVEKSPSGNMGIVMPVRLGSMAEMGVNMEKMGREWAEGRPTQPQGVNMPIRMGSIAEIGVDAKDIGREWSEGRPSSTMGINMPIRVGSIADISMDFNAESDSSLSVSQSDSTTTGVTFYSTGSSLADNFPNIQRHARCAV